MGHHTNGTALATRRWVRAAGTLVCALVSGTASLAAGGAGALGGRWFVVAEDTAGSVAATSQDGGTLDLVPRRHAWLANWRPLAGASTRGRTARGLGLRDDNDGGGSADDPSAGLLAVSLRTGGPAYGVTIYRREGDRWHGRWVTSIDSAGAAGEMWIEHAAAAPLAGRHHFTGARPGTGHFEGNVTIAAKGGDAFTLSYAVGGATVYRGLGVLLADGTRLAVAWSFGSAPALAIYQAADDGGRLTGRRLSLARGGNTVAVLNEAFSRQPTDPPATRADGLFYNPSPGGQEPLPGADPGLGNTTEAAGATTPDPAAPDVRTWSYAALQRQHGAHAQADRWLADQLDLDEQLLLEAALRRHQARKEPLGDATVAALIDEERKLDEADRRPRR